MSRFTLQERKLLELNKHVKKVTSSNISFTARFKKEAVKQFESGASAENIFEKSGIKISLFGVGYPGKSISRWRDILESEGAEALGKERRGTSATGRPKGRKFKSEKEELAYLREESDFLKKLHALGKNSQKKKNSR